MGSSKCTSVITQGSKHHVVTIECHTSNNLPTIIITGSASRTVCEARDRLRAAFSNSRLALPRKRITLHIAPAALPKNESCLDLALAVAILLKNEQNTNYSRDQVCLGELGLDGTVRPIRGILGKMQTAMQRGINTFFVPRANIRQATLLSGATIYAVDSLVDIYHHLCKKQLITAAQPSTATLKKTPPSSAIAAIRGHEQAKRILAISAAGRHNVLFIGPPGSGKTLLAHAAADYLGPMTTEEIIETTNIHSMSLADYTSLISERPVRSPHHTATERALTGGGNPIQPGEISLSHNGILVLDEFPEFSREAITTLRQPLESSTVSITRASGSAQFMARMLLIATANPCPCGYYGHPTTTCVCDGASLNRYKSKLSGPVIDRIDLCVNVAPTPHATLLSEPEGDHSDKLLAGVQQAHELQNQRYRKLTGVRTNADLTTAQLAQSCALSKAATDMLNTASDRLALSSRAYVRCVKVARTIADIEGATTVSPAHISEALQYRPEQAFV